MKKEIPIVGMHCASCAKLIEKKLKKLPGVESAMVNYGSEQAVVSFDTHQIKLPEIGSAIDSLGYKALITNDDDMIKVSEEKEGIKILELQTLKTTLQVSILLTIIIVLFSLPHMLPGLIMLPASFEPLIGYLLFFLTIPVQFWAGREFYLATISGLKNRAASMDTLVSVGTTAAFLYSTLSVFTPSLLERFGIPMGLYFDTCAVVITLILLGRYLEARAKAHTSSAIKKLMNLAPKTAKILTTDTTPISQEQFLEKKNYEEKEVPLESIQTGNLLRVKPGEKIPVDGVILFGNSTIDESMVTGESIPVDKKEKDTVIGGTINTTGSFVMIATKVGKETMLSRIISMVSEAQSSKAPIARLADTVAGVFVPLVLMLSILVFMVWYVVPIGGFAIAFTTMITVLIIACPCALGLATPTAILVAVGKAAELGILVKDAQSLELAGKIHAVVFDKTGTITQGKPTVTNIHFTKALPNSVSEEELTIAIKSLESLSEHPLSHAIVAYISGKTVEVTHFQNIEGFGISGTINGKKYLIGKIGLMEQKGLDIPPDLSSATEESMKKGNTVAMVAVDDHVTAAIGLSDQLKPDASRVMKKLHNQHITSYLVTGDNEKTANAIGIQTGITHIFAHVLPQEKAKMVERIKKDGLKENTMNFVAFVGDGVNDAPALSTADVGIAINTGTDIAMESASIVLLNTKLESIISLLVLSKKTTKIIRENLFWAFGYNIILIPVAAGILYPFTHTLLSPALAGMAMAFSSVSVVSNSLRIKRIKTS